MLDEKPLVFGELLKQLIKEQNMTQYEFYTQLGIKKPYFYDIISGKVNPPPPPLQIRAMDILQADEETRIAFYDLAAKSRNELPADIALEVFGDPVIFNDIRALIKNRKKCVNTTGGNIHG